MQTVTKHSKPIQSESVFSSAIYWRARFYEHRVIFRVGGLITTRGRFHKRFCALMPNFRALSPTFEKLFTGANVGRRAKNIGAGRKTVYDIDPCIAFEFTCTLLPPLPLTDASKFFSFVFREKFSALPFPVCRHLLSSLSSPSLSLMLCRSFLVWLVCNENIFCQPQV